MTRLLLWIALFVVAAFVSARAARTLAVSGPLRRINYRGLSVPTAAGIAVLLGVLCATALLTLLSIVFDDSGRLADGRAEAFLFALVAAAYAFLGLWDDLSGNEDDRGWRAHLTAVRHGHATAGAMKVVGGSAIALIFGVLGETLLWSVIAALVIALSANAFNLLDVRPGRACKWFLVAMVAISFVPGPSMPPLAIAAGAAGAFLSFDLRERAMLGDTGAMALGGMAGVAFVLSGHTVELVALAILAIMHVVADKPGLSHVLDVVPPLRMLDRAGRVPE